MSIDATYRIIAHDQPGICGPFQRDVTRSQLNNWLPRDMYEKENRHVRDAWNDGYPVNGPYGRVTLIRCEMGLCPPRRKVYGPSRNPSSFAS